MNKEINVMYVKPEMELEEYEVHDILTASGLKLEKQNNPTTEENVDWGAIF